MIVHDFHIIGMTIAPFETDAPPVIDSNAMLTDAIPRQRFKPVSLNGRQIPKIGCRVKPTQPFMGGSFDALKLPAAEAIMQSFGFQASERLDHSYIVLCFT
jgi:hypothetical protein